jgi:HSP20 family protein
MAYTHLIPLRDFERFQSQIGRVFDEAFRRTIGRGGEEDWASSTRWPALEVFERHNEIVVQAELPGVDPKDIDIRLENNVLTISGERRCDDEAGRGRSERREFCYGAFGRSIALPVTIEQERIQAELKDGILTLTLPKSEKARPRQIPIQGAQQQQLSGSRQGTEREAAAADPRERTVPKQQSEDEPELTGIGRGSEKKQR